MFLTTCSPLSKKPIGSFSPICSRTEALTQISPGSASASRRAATLTPSPKMSPSSTITSPRLIPGLESSDLWPHRSKPTRGDQGRGTAPVKTSQGWYNADAIANAVRFGQVRVAVLHSLLRDDGAAHRIDDAGEFN